MKPEKLTAKKQSFTPGPWYAVEYAGFADIQDGPFYGDDNIFNAECDDRFLANAKLAASAPDMLEALKELQELTSESYGMLPISYIRGLIQAAIAKAEGN